MGQIDSEELNGAKVGGPSWMKRGWPFSCFSSWHGAASVEKLDKPVPAFLMRLQVRNGFGAMPAFSDKEISAEELGDLIDY